MRKCAVISIIKGRSVRLVAM